MQGKKRSTIPEATKIALYHKQKGQCAKCGTRKHLEIHHIKPRSLGGSNELENLKLLCFSCHKKHHFIEQASPQLGLYPLQT